MGDGSSPVISAGIVIATVVSMFAAGSVIAGDALAWMIPW